MTTRYLGPTAAILILTTAVPLSADRVKLRSGKVIEGMFMGADSKSVRVLLDDGQVSEGPIADATSVEFSARKPATPPPPKPTPKPAAAAPAPAPAAAPASRVVTVPAGTPINVRLTQGVDVDSSQAGMTFKGVVDDPVMVGGSIVIPRGSSAVLQAVKVEQSGKMKGSDKITLKLNAVGFGGMMHESRDDLRRVEGQGRREKDRSQNRRRRRPRRDRWRHRRWRRGGGDWRGDRRRDRSGCRRRRRGTSQGAGRNTPAISAHVGR